MGTLCVVKGCIGKELLGGVKGKQWTGIVCSLMVKSPQNNTVHILGVGVGMLKGLVFTGRK